MEKLSLLLVSDDPLARAGLAYLLTEQLHYKITDQMSSQVWLDNPQLDEEPLPDVVVWDVGWEIPVGWKIPVGWEMPPAVPDVMLPELPVLVLVSDAELAADMWAVGLRVILRRTAEPEQLEAALQAAVQGLMVLDPAFVGRLAPVLGDGAIGIQESLTPRELEVLHLLAEGKTNKAIAQELEISSHTVKFHVTSLMGKLNAQSRTEAVVRATRLGLIAL